MAVRPHLVLFGFFLLAAAVCARLGFWQVNRLQERRAVNAVAQAARSAPVVMLQGTDEDGGMVNRRVQVRGRYDHAHEIVVRGRQYRGVPGVEIVTPLVLEGRKAAVLVNRGFVPAPDAVTAKPELLREPGTRWVEGIALAIDSGSGAPLRHRGQVTWARLDRPALRSELPYPVSPVYLRQFPDSALPSFPRRLDPPLLDDGPHLSYAIQWFAFAIIALVFGGVMLRQKRER
jgi:surfeit locus 1 family protein